MTQVEQIITDFSEDRYFVPQHDKSPAICHAEVRSISTIKLLLKINFIWCLFFLFSCNQNSPEEKTVAIDSATTKVEQPIAEVVDTPKTKQEIEPTKAISKVDTTAQQKVTVEIFNNDTTTDAALHGYGYNILMDGKLYVHQPHIPAVPGNKGFASVADAKKAGAFIKYKVEHHIMPPSVTVQELDSLKITH